MPYARPNLTSLQQQAVQDLFGTNIGGLDAVQRNGKLFKLAMAIAGMAYLHYAYQDYIALQAVPWTATDEFAAGWGALKGVYVKDATAATGTAAFPGTVGTVVPTGTAVTTTDGILYASTAEATVSSNGTVLVPIQAGVAGSSGNAVTGVALSLANGLAGITAAGQASGAIVGGTDQETEDAFKARYLQVYAAPSQGGAVTDYVEWAEAVPGVTRAWCNPLGAGAGTVVVYVMLDVAEAANNDGFPVGTNGVAAAETRDSAATGDQLTVANALYVLRPATALVYVVAPTPYPVPFTIKTQTVVTTAVRALVSAAIDAVFLEFADPLGGVLDTSPFEDAIRVVSGMPRFTLTAPVAEFSAPLGSLPIRSTVSYA